MGFLKDNANASERKDTYVKLENIQVSRVKVVNDKILSFNLNADGITIYSMKYIDGAKGAFIAPPSSKGTNGQYYPCMFIRLTKEEEDKIKADVLRQYKEGGK